MAAGGSVIPACWAHGYGSCRLNSCTALTAGKESGIGRCGSSSSCLSASTGPAERFTQYILHGRALAAISSIREIQRNETTGTKLRG